MNYIIHLTEECNLKCKYCYEKNKSHGEIPFDYIKNIINNESKNEDRYSVITFYGGEPLLKKNLIRNTIEYVKAHKIKKKFYYGITTNGIFLDDKFLKYMKKNNFVNVAYSIDGIEEAHNLNRVLHNGEGTYESVYKNAKKLLKYFKDAVAMCVVTKNNIKYLSKSVRHLINLGFSHVNILFDYSEEWQEEDLVEIKKQYRDIGQVYYEMMVQEKNIFIPLVDEKIKTHIKNNYNCNKDCSFGIKSVNVGIDGKYYPCTQFVKNSKYVIGNVKDGIDIEARAKLLERAHKEIDTCKDCFINRRCKHTCACKNYAVTNEIDQLSPLVCEMERIAIEVADDVAEKLYAIKSKIFMKKFYTKEYY